MKHLVIIFFSTFCLNSCVSDEGKSTTKEEDKRVLETLAGNIELLINTTVCSDAFDCKFIAFGSKPCGGPWSFLVYSTSIDEEKLQNMVEDYNQKEALYNTKWGVFSDCSLATPPTDITCENNRCRAIY